MSPRDKNSRNVRRDCFVISGIPSELSEVDILPRLARQNASRLRTTERDLLSRFRSVKTLQRRLASGKDAGKWVPSSSVCVYTDPKLVSSVLTLGLVILDYQTYSVHPFEMPVLQCEHCGKTGHTAKYCRGICHRRRARHATAPCPLAPRRNLEHPRQQDSHFPTERGENPASEGTGPDSTTGPTRSPK